MPKNTMPKMTKRQFEEMFRKEILPGLIEREQQRGSAFPDKPGRREAWNNMVDAYMRDRQLPESAGGWGHPRWLETARGSSKAARHDHAVRAKKPPAQLDREIAQVLDGRHALATKRDRRPRTTIKESHATKQQKLDEFTRQYLETALWSETDDGGTPYDRNYSTSDFAPEALAAAIKVAKEFQAKHEDDLNETSGDDGQHGHDFWLTRNGHGAGFWDRGYGPVGERLTKAAKAYGSEDIYVGDDGLLYFA